ncbi:amidase family protein [Mycolicibacterium neoaurum]|uniref:amidase family protein n=1 Tax=Mycolicibacterium neoaurum TaxID=1795 RepID=UPI00142166A6|nr:amidase family protein [Mycolicibacterium neoaurum]
MRSSVMADEHTELTTFADAIASMLDSLAAVAPLPSAATTHREDLGPARHHEDPCNALVRRTHVVGTVPGPLSDMRVSVKDSIAMAGIPLTCGSAVLRDFTPTGDATVVRRLLDGGATITAVTNMDDLAFAGSGETSVYGPTLNPHDRSLLAGGSSGGAAASLLYEDDDLAVGTDQGGSVRVPASWCGTLGFKPTHGLIPYTGVAPMEPTLDHVGLLSRSVEPLTRALAVVAGPDGQDLRQHRYPRSIPLALNDRSSVDLGNTRLRIVTVTRNTADAPVRAAFDDVVERLRFAGAKIGTTELDPAELGPVGTGLFVEGMRHTIEGVHPAYGGSEYQWVEYTEALRKGIRDRHDELSPQIKATLLAAGTLHGSSPNRAYSRAVMAAERLRTSYRAALEEADFLIEPTVPSLPVAVSGGPTSVAGLADRAWAPLANTVGANIAGLPSISLPLGTSHGLPVGIMVTGKPWHDWALLEFAASCEQQLGWVKPA